MTRRHLFFRVWLLIQAMLMLTGNPAPAQEAGGESQSFFPSPITRISDLRRLVREEGRAICALSLTGIVTATNLAPGSLILQDDSGAAPLELSGESPSLRPGQQIQIASENCLVAGQLDQIVIGSREAVVDNDGIHARAEATGEVFIGTSRCPLRVCWFNAQRQWALDVFYQGPGLPRQRIPDGALFRPDDSPVEGTNHLLCGLNYRCYEGDWQRLPDFSKLRPVKTGSVANFDTAAHSRDEFVGLEFSGLLEVPRAGRYRFFLDSDDGSLLFLGGGTARCEPLQDQVWPAVKTIMPGRSMTEDDEFQWTEVEGLVESVAHDGRHIFVDLGSESERLVLIPPGGAQPGWDFLLNGRIRARGAVQSLFNRVGERVAGRLLVPGDEQVAVLQIASDVWQKYPVNDLADFVWLAGTNASRTPVHLTGVAGLPVGNGFRLWDARTNSIEVRLAFAFSDLREQKVEVLGFPIQAGANLMLVDAVCRPLQAEQTGGSPLPTLTTIEQIRQLKAEEAKRRYPVRIKGVVTLPEYRRWGSIHNGHEGINVLNLNSGDNRPAQVGEYCEIQGETRQFGFGPMIACTNRTRIGNGFLPEPLHPTFEQLINGSLDGQWVEVEGGVLQQTADPEGCTLLIGMAGGRVPIFIPRGMQDPASIGSQMDGIVRARGVVMPTFNAQRQIESVRLFVSSTRFLAVIEAAPADPFAGPTKHVRELLYFDSRAVFARRVKVQGLVVYAGNERCYLMDAGDGLKFAPKRQLGKVQVGDLVEAVGYSELGNEAGAPTLREALVRKVGQAALPAPKLLSEENFLDAANDSTLMRAKARLVDVTIKRGETVFEFQLGPRTGTARLAGEISSAPQPGSLLQLTGVYAGQGGSRVLGHTFDSFELLLNSPGDVVVLVRPPWWNWKMTMIVVGVLVAIVMMAFVWITALRRQVEERTRQLASQIQERQRAEQQRALEHERSRVAQDLHDELGAGLTEVGILGALVKNPAISPEKKSGYLDQVTQLTNNLVTALDEIVWAVNPRYDSVSALRGYFSLHAQRLLELSSIRCALDMAADLPDHPLDSKTRHSLFLAYKEALNNLVKHAQATEARLGMRIEHGTLLITIADDGRGLDSKDGSPDGNGLSNMRERLHRLGGQCVIQSGFSQGTTVTFRLPLHQPKSPGTTTALQP